MSDKPDLDPLIDRLRPFAHNLFFHAPNDPYTPIDLLSQGGACSVQVVWHTGRNSFITRTSLYECLVEAWEQRP